MDLLSNLLLIDIITKSGQFLYEIIDWKINKLTCFNWILNWIEGFYIWNKTKYPPKLFLFDWMKQHCFLKFFLKSPADVRISIRNPSCVFFDIASRCTMYFFVLFHVSLNFYENFHFDLQKNIQKLVDLILPTSCRNPTKYQTH